MAVVKGWWGKRHDQNTFQAILADWLQQSGTGQNGESATRQAGTMALMLCLMARS